ncbi:PREDICTED: disintegrin and metalloproteinase domain-containing protein 8 [Ceratotherium simum simum]|uniref:Disintegrin and metalloproteinase domain-containing protein 8 n=1 Tax=Ceratotherium simum simum TaxID=73337 RepID=A0ABM1DCM2_CERSS|nr:PREDICTED: disintegrin and metalloproteinase domain-containing protein 8 [Ceratotherium simum simum]
MCSLGLWLLGTLWLQAVAPSTALPHVKQYEVVWPRRLPGPRARRAQPSHLGLYPESVSYVLGAQEHNFTLHLQKNRDLVGSGYTETYMAANGSQVTEQLQRQDHCFYQGRVEGHRHSAASLSTCAGLRGFFRAGSAIHLIEPLGGGGEEGQHALYEVQHLQQKAGTCGVSDSSLESILGPRVSAAFRPRNWPPSRETRYVELFVVTDSTEFQKLGSRTAVRKRVLEVVNHVDKLYQELSFRVVLVGLEIWNGGDKIQVSPQADTTLENFLSWRARDLVGRQLHDNAQLITGVDFAGTTVGLARVSAMCLQSSSGAVNQDHSENPIGVASTMAHEMGHNLGMDHDENVQGCYCPVPRDGGGCVMAASIGLKFPRMFSHCSRADLETFVEKPQTACVVNAPDPDRLVGGPVCGNRFVERGEQCDCGAPQDCQNRCCNATTCQLAQGAECAQGACCHACRVKPAGELCRPQKDGCDLEEYCDGQQPACPEDAFQENGTPCPGGYCYDGNCPTLAQRCQDLWGPGEAHVSPGPMTHRPPGVVVGPRPVDSPAPGPAGSRAAEETCYAYSISLGCRGSVPLSSSRVNRCGVLYCEGGQKPPERTSCTLTSHSSACQALALDGSAAYEPVPEGTQCGEEKVCWKGFCQDFHVYRSRNCSAQCSNHGVCNHRSECHCRPGWAPPHCAELLPNTASGSLPMVLVPVLLLVALALTVAGVVIYRKAWRPVRRR